jgi:pimeloyl-ACP methyl ester carboxylesterase
MKKLLFAVIVAVVALVVGVGQPAAEPDVRGHGHFAEVHGLHMYYEVWGQPHGKPPLVLLHGGISAIGTSFGNVLPQLAKHRQVIAVEQQAHGHTADIDRPLSTGVMADDTVELLRQLGINQADFYGYSMGGEVALDLGIRYPDRVRKLVLQGVAWNKAGNYPGILEGVEQVRPEDLFGTPFYEEYLRIAPRPQDFPRLVERIKEQARTQVNQSPEAIRAMGRPAQVIVGDSDIIRPEHAVELFRLVGGGVPGDIEGLPDSELAILPATTHLTVADRDHAGTLLRMIPAFLDRPITSGR